MSASGYGFVVVELINPYISVTCQCGMVFAVTPVIVFTKKMLEMCCILQNAQTK